MSQVYAAIMAAPFGRLGIVVEGDALSRIEFLAPDTEVVVPTNATARQACAQLQAYFKDPNQTFALPLKPIGTPFQLSVWQQLAQIPLGATLTYGDVAKRLGTAARAVGQACGANPLPIVVPCHRVVARNGTGGFMHSRGDAELNIKHWLLRHEARGRRAA